MASQRPGVYLLGILHDFNTSNPSMQRRKRTWYSGGTSSSHPSSRVQNSWNRRLACNTYGAANPNGSKSFEKKLKTTLLVIHKSGAKTEPLKVKQSSDASHNKPRTLKDSRSRYLSLKSRCNISATSGLLDPHFTKGMLACDMILIASFTMVQHSSTESAPDTKSSAYMFSFNSSTTLDSGKPDKWNCTVAFSRNGLLQLPKGTLVNLITLVVPLTSQRKRCTPQSSFLTPVCRNAFSMSDVIAICHRRKRSKISVRLDRRHGPTSIQSFRDRPLNPLADASNTGLTFVDTDDSLKTAPCGI